MLLQEVADPDIRLGDQGGVEFLICFPVPHVYLFVREGTKSKAQLDRGHGRIFPLWIDN